MIDKKMYELTNPQKSIWYTEQYYKGTSINNICGSVFIREKIDFNILSEAINSFIKNNDSFKLRFTFIDGVPHQYFIDDQTYKFDTIKVLNNNELNNHAKKLAAKPFEIIESQLFNFTLFKFPNGQGGFIINAHHIISDAATFAILVTEIINNYSLIKNNQEIPLKEYSYLDYINSEKEYLSSSRYEKDKAYWNDLYKEIPGTATIPTLKNQIEKPDSLREEFKIDLSLLNKISDFCKENHISLYNFLIAIYSIYIGRINNTNNFSIGTPILNRSNFAERHTSGMFISTSLLKINTEENLSFNDFVKNIGTLSMSMLRHQKFNYQCILDHLRASDPSIANLYDIVLSYQITKAKDNSLKIPYDIKWYNTPYNGNSLSIHFHDNNDSGNVLIEYDYQSSKYDKEDIINMHKRICYLFNQVLKNPDIFLNDIEIVTPEEKNQILKEFNNTKTDFNFEKNIVLEIEKMALSHKNKIAIKYKNDSITYSELICRVNQLANVLIKKFGIAQKTCIGISTNRTIDTIIGILAILKINCTYVPIDPTYPEDRIKHMVKVSQIALVLSDNINKDRTMFSNLTALDINYKSYRDESSIFDYNFIYDINSNLYIVFTSGSTGVPKGVTITHKNMMNLISFEKTKTKIFKKNSSILQFATMSFDVSYQEIYSSLLTGNTLVLADDETRKNIKKLSTYIEKNKIDILFIPPAYLRLLTEDSETVNKISKSIKSIITAGEQLIITNGISALMKKGIKLYNHYGPAETHVATTYNVLNSSVVNPPVGCPISNSQVIILDKTNNIMPNEILGQISISGDCVGNGYYNNPELTEKKFIKNKFTNTNMYLTGDLGYCDKKGIIHFVGRKDSQIKINGFRIELDEIDNVIVKNKEIDSAKSIIKEENNKKYIITFYKSSKLKENDLSNYLKTKLPYYMLPSKLIKLDEMPLNSNGKINKALLPDVTISQNDYHKKAHSETETTLQQIWKSMFNLKKLGVNANFFEIGGDSLLAIKLGFEIYTALNIDISVQEIFANPTIEELAKIIDNKECTEHEKIENVELAEFYPASSAQKRIYYASTLSDKIVTYNMPGAIIFSNKPDIQKLEDCFNKIIERHESLRTYFDVVDGEIVQKIKSVLKIKLELEKSNKNKDIIFEEFVKPFDLSKTPLIRIKMVKTNSHYMLLFDTHHIISDGISIRNLLSELSELYNDNELDQLEISYKDYSIWEQESLKNNGFKESEKYWLDQFKGDIPVLNLPTNHNRSLTQSFNGSDFIKKLSPAMTQKISIVARRLNITPYMFLFACYYILLYKYTSNNDIVVGTPNIGREYPAIEKLIGMFVNTLAIRTQIDSDLTFEEFSNRLKNVFLNGFEHKTYPFDELVKKLNIKRDSSRNPLFDTMFIYQNEGYKNIHLGNIKSTYYIPKTTVSKFDLSVEVIPVDKYLNIRFEYDTDLFDKQFIETLSVHFINIINTVLNDPKIKMYDIDMITTKEKDVILNKFNSTKFLYNKKETIPTLFEKQVSKSPNKTAVIFENTKYTYKQLNQKANQLANYLINKKIKPNDVVGVLLPRSFDLIVSIWGILKSGASYMLIDSSLPNERINYMLNQSNASLLITKKDFKKVDFKNTLNFDDVDLDNEIDKNIKIKISKEDNLAVIFTSGSTGEPKGVLLKQQGLMNLLHTYQKLLNTNICKNFLCSSSVSFDMFLVETFIPLLSGKTIVLANEDERKIPNYTSKLITDKNVEFILTTPSRIDLLLNPDFASCLKNVKVIQLGGEVLTPILFNKLTKNTKANIYNGYGPTEITACCSSKKVKDGNNITIGKSVTNTKIIVVDKDLNLCPVNVPGELCVQGDGVSKGYINNSVATNKSFILTKYSNLITYKTGDIAKYTEKGELIYLGRNDSQIKIRGLRIELSEIENKFLLIPGIEKCSVIYKKENNNSFIVAFFTSNKEYDISYIREKLAETLPLYMIPKYIIKLDQMPITQNGKTNYKELHNYKIDLLESNYKSPKTEKEKLFCSILENLLNIKVGTEDDLFELGMDSLIAIKFKVELMNQNIDLPYPEIFKHHTVKELCNLDSNEIEAKPIYDYNFDSINKVLNKNTYKKNVNIIKSNNNNVLLLGSTGFVGAHILNSFIDNDTGNIYCIVRDKNNTLARTRFIETMHFYFGKKLDKYIDKRIFILKGDLLKENFDLSIANINILKDNISIVINSAANVKHFGNVEKFNNINVGLINNLIGFCKENNKRLIHLSSLSISGNMVLDGSISRQSINKSISFTEKNLYINQALDNVYTRSKFEAERLILENIYTGLDAQILRLGNITNRISDGDFQINPTENAFLTRVSSLANIGAVPESIMGGYVEFTPVDCCANAIISIIQNYVKNYSVFHVYDYNHVYMNKLIKQLQKNGIDFKILNNDEFSNLLMMLIKDSEKKKYVSGIVNDLNSDKKLNYDANVNIKSDFSIKFLGKIGFKWPVIDAKYIKLYVEYMRKNKFI